MRMDDLKGRLALFKFAEDIRESLPLFQIYKDEVWAVVTGIEDFGIWIENPSYELGVWWDEEGKLIPPHQQKQEKLKTHIFVPWRYIKALMSVEDERFQRVKSERLPGFQIYR